VGSFFVLKPGGMNILPVVYLALPLDKCWYVHTTRFGVNYLPHIKYTYIPWRDMSGGKVRDLANFPPKQKIASVSMPTTLPPLPPPPLPRIMAPHLPMSPVQVLGGAACSHHSPSPCFGRQKGTHQKLIDGQGHNLRWPPFCQ
jgi:hypothetical protein